MDKKEFVNKCGELLRIAKPHLVSAEYRIGAEMPKSKFTRYVQDDEYVLITCENGFTYGVNITANSLNAIAEEIFRAMSNK